MRATQPGNPQESTVAKYLVPIALTVVGVIAGIFVYNKWIAKAA